MVIFRLRGLIAAIHLADSFPQQGLQMIDQVLNRGCYN